MFEICAGAGGQSIGLEGSGLELIGAVEIDRDLQHAATEPPWVERHSGFRYRS